nr:thioredoxin-like domain-containing protein [uncultured Carboxylicivirga sp.]
MKKVIIAFIFSLIAFQLWSQQKPNVFIEGQILNYDGKSKVRYSISSVSGNLGNYIVKPDSLGRFVVSAYITNAEFFHFYETINHYYHMCRLLIEPDNRYSIVSEGQQEADWKSSLNVDVYTLESYNTDATSFYTYNKGLVEYNKIPNYIHGSLFHDEWNLNAPESLLDSMKSKIQNHLRVFDQLLEKGEISQQLYDISKMNIEYMYAERLATTIRSSFHMPQFQIKDSVIINQLNKVYPQIFELYPVKGKKMSNLFNMVEYTDIYLEFREDYHDGVYSSVKRKGDASFAPIYAKSGEVLSEEANKQYQAIKNMCNTAALAPNSLKLSKKYLDDNSDMKDSYAGKVLRKMLMPRAEEYELIALRPMPEECVIVSGDSINSIAEIIKMFEGSPMLIDCWGTWCMPCRNQFNYMDEVKTLMKTRGMKMVYIAYEYTEDKQMWESLMKEYNLVGYHIKANQLLKKDMQRLYNNQLSFPTFMIVDGDGNILEPKAPYASDGNKLYKKIDDLINNPYNTSN